jgi:hypothetical protein
MNYGLAILSIAFLVILVVLFALNSIGRFLADSDVLSPIAASTLCVIAAVILVILATKNYYSNPELFVAFDSLIIIGLIVGLLLLNYEDLLKSARESLTISLDKNNTFHHDRIRIVMGDTDNHSLKRMSISGLDGSDTKYVIYSSMFTDGKHFIDPKDFKFYDESAGRSMNRTAMNDGSGNDVINTSSDSGSLGGLEFQPISDRSYSFNILIMKNIDPGSYYGWFIFNDTEFFYIPVRISTSPMIWVSIGIVIIGTLTSIAVIEFDRYAKRIKFKSIEAGATAVVNDPNATEFDKQVNKWVTSKAHLMSEVYRKRYANFTSTTRTIIIDLIPAVLAVVLAAVLVDNELIGDISEVNLTNLFILFSIGAGIEGVKAFFDLERVGNKD